MPEIEVPKSPTAEAKGGQGWSPHEVDPELARAKVASDIFKMFPRPAIVTKELIVRFALVMSLNHSENNRTGLNLDPRVLFYGFVEKESVNILGYLIEHMFVYLNAPKVVIQGMQGQNFVQEEKPGLVSSVWQRLVGWGGDQGDTGRADNNPKRAGNSR